MMLQYVSSGREERNKQPVIGQSQAPGDNGISHDGQTLDDERLVGAAKIGHKAAFDDALYLENNLTPCAFTSDRVSVLELLASQAAISLENGILYSDLQRSEAYLAQGQSIRRTGSFGWNVSSGEIYWSEETFKIFEYERAV